jgi:hypothetical protein
MTNQPVALYAGMLDTAQPYFQKITSLQPLFRQCMHAFLHTSRNWDSSSYNTVYA